MSSEFPEYAVKFSSDAKESRDRLPDEARAVLSKILDELTDDPDKFPERVVPTSQKGASFLYFHPDPAVQIAYEIDRERKIIFFFHFSAPALKTKKTVFISYSHKDIEWLRKLRVFLSSLEQQGVIEFWDDSALDDGKPWQTQLEDVLNNASAGVLLVSQDFLSSKFVTEVELPKLMQAAAEKGNRIFWVPLSPSTVFDTHEDITKYQSLLSDPKTSLEELEDTQQKKVFVDITRRISQAMTAH